MLRKCSCSRAISAAAFDQPLTQIDHPHTLWLSCLTAGAVQLKWFGHGLKGVYSEVNGVPQIYWPQNKNVWKCITGLEHALDTSKASKGGKKWYDGLTNDATQTHPGLDFSSL